MTDPVLSVRDLHVTLHRDGTANCVLDGVSFEVMAGCVTALVGESGSGKSTIGLAAQGLLARDADPRVTGSIRLAGTEVVGASAPVLRHVRRNLVRMVPQDPLAALDPVMRVVRQLCEGGPLPGSARRTGCRGLACPMSPGSWRPGHISFRAGSASAP